jgi:hypothetical protein
LGGDEIQILEGDRCGGRSDPPDNVGPYGGRYKIDGGKLIVYPEVASSPAPSLTERECKPSPQRVDCA